MNNLLSEGLSLMVFGMGFVFVFLTLLVVVTSQMSRLVSKYEPAPSPAAPRRPAAAPTTTTAPAQQQDELVAVMSAAIHKYRSRQ